jgi:DNA-binding XRE family transcriptional regulator
MGFARLLMLAEERLLGRGLASLLEQPARIEAGVSQEAAAHAAGMAVGTVSKLEQGRTDPGFSTMTRPCRRSRRAAVRTVRTAEARR